MMSLSKFMFQVNSNVVKNQENTEPSVKYKHGVSRFVLSQSITVLCFKFQVFVKDEI